MSLLLKNKFESKVEARSVITVFLQLKNNVIDLNSTYQRENVWLYKNRRLFIDSIIKGIVPNNIIINKDTNIDGPNNVCIDGKQRLTSILEFMNNQYPVPISNELVFYEKIKKDFDRKNIEKIYRNYNFRNMTTKERNEFGDTTLSISVYTNLSYPDQSEIFERIQNGMTLTTGEKITSNIKDEKTALLFSEICISRTKQLIKVFTPSQLRKYFHKNFISDIIFMIIEEKYKIYKSNEKKELFKKLNCEILNNMKNKIYELFDFFFNQKLYNHNYIKKIDQKYLSTIIYWTYCKYKNNYIKTISNDKECNILLNLFEYINQEIKSGNLKKISERQLKRTLIDKYKEIGKFKNIKDILNKLGNNNDNNKCDDDSDCDNDSDDDSDDDSDSDSEDNYNSIDDNSDSDS